MELRFSRAWLIACMKKVLEKPQSPFRRLTKVLRSDTKVGIKSGGFPLWFSRKEGNPNGINTCKSAKKYVLKVFDASYVWIWKKHLPLIKLCFIKFLYSSQHDNSLFMFIKGKGKDAYALVNVEALKSYPMSCVEPWAFWHWHTWPTTLFPNSVYCVDEPTECEFVINQCQAEYLFRNNGKAFSLEGTKYANEFTIGGGGYLGFVPHANAPQMIRTSGSKRGKFIAEVAGSQLSGTIISFKVEKNKLPDLKQVSANLW